MAKSPRGITFWGDGSDNDIGGTAGADNLGGAGGNDTIFGGDGNDRLYGHTGDDWLDGQAGNDTLHGNEGHDTLHGGDGDDYLAGQEGNDIVDGGAGNDFVGAGPGNDSLTGGLGGDRFFFAQAFETAMNHHTITDFARGDGDYIDLLSIDADGVAANNTRKGNTDFTWVSGPSTVAGTAWTQDLVDPATGEKTGVSIYLNSDADPEPDMRIDVLGATSLTPGVDIFG